MKPFKPWVRKLTGKPACATPADCEFDARRIHDFYAALFSVAAARTAFRIHSDLLSGDLAIAARIRLASSGLTLNSIKIDRFSAFGTLGRPSFDFINIFSITKIIVDGNHTLGNTFSQQRKTSMANNLPFEKKVMVISMLCEGSSIRAIEDHEWTVAELVKACGE